MHLSHNYDTLHGTLYQQFEKEQSNAVEVN